MEKKDSIDNIWYTIQEETERRVNAEPVLASFFHTTVLEHSSFSSAVADLIANEQPHKYIQNHNLERFEKGINLDERGAGPDPKLHG